MAEAFVGLNVSVLLKDPPVSLSGLVAGVKGQRLYLTDVRFLKSGKELKEYTIHGAEIADIEVLPDPPLILTPGLQNTSANSSRAHEGNLRKAELAPQTQLADPAILSFARSPSTRTALLTNPSSGLPIVRVIPENFDNRRDDSAQFERRAVLPAVIQSATPQASTPGVPDNDSTPLDAPIDNFDIQSGQGAADDFHETLPVIKTIQSAVEAPTTEAHLTVARNSRPPARRRKRGKPKRNQEQLGGDDPDTSPENDKKGWRQTPILQHQTQTDPSLSSRSTQEIIDGKLGLDTHIYSTQKSRRQRNLERETANGWATEDASDVHGMGDFDFEANLSKFDKLAVWDELRNGDTTADEDRLVSLNRIKPPVPGTFGGKKLLPSENVLDRPLINSPVYDFGDIDDDLDPGRRTTSRRARRDPSKSSLRQPGSRKDSMNGGQEFVAPLIGSQRSLTNRSLSQAKHSDSHSGASPRAQEDASPASSMFSPSAPDNRNGPSLRYIKNDQVCRTMAPETLEAVENLALNGFGMSEDILAENAGRGIAEMVLRTINPKGHRLSHPNHNSLPVVVVLVGDNKAGGRALAAARHLLERNVRVVASLTGSVDLETGPLSAQIHRFRGKFLRTWAETSAYLKTLDAPPELIIDSLLGVQSTFEDLEPNQLVTAMDMLAWANKSKASVLAVDVPSGVDSSTGAVEMREGEPAEVRAKIVVSCGAPCTGLFEALLSRQNEDAWRIFVVDIGINPAARPFLKVNTNKKDSHHRGKYIQFGSDWVVGLRYDTGNMN